MTRDVQDAAAAGRKPLVLEFAKGIGSALRKVCLSVKTTGAFRWLLILVIIGALAPGDAASREDDPFAAVRDHLHPGRTAETITSMSDPSQSYAVRLPKNYSADQKWPVLLLMDPRGQAMVPLERFRQAADRRSYILMSSYNTASDTGEDLNSATVKAMINDAPHLFSAAEDRFYLVGFSGTARTAWTFAQMYEKNVAGIIAFGGGLPLGHTAPENVTFSHYGAAGVLDFNFEEMVQLDRDLDLREIHHTFERYEGGHQWGSAKACARSLDWMELVAMKEGRRAVDSVLVEDIFEKRMAAAETIAFDRPYQAYLLFRAMQRDFQGLVGKEEMADLTQLLERLEPNDEVIRAERAQDESVDRYYRHKKRFVELLDAVDTEMPPPDAETMKEALEIVPLKRQAEASFMDEAGAIRTLSAQRLLELVYVQCTSYLPRDYIADGRPWAAILALEVADSVRRMDLDFFLDHHRLESLREEPAFQDWMSRRDFR